LYGSDDADNDIVATVPDVNCNVAVNEFPGCVPCVRTDIDGIIVSRIKQGKNQESKFC
jgi:hypothetical protein